MKLYEELEKRLVKRNMHNVISITGGGGKTTLLRLFGQYLKNEGYSVLITTTTKIQNPRTYDFGVDIAFQEEEKCMAHYPRVGELVFYAEKNPENDKKMTSPGLSTLSRLSKMYDVILIEADGARCLPVKMHTDRDPVIIPETTATIGIVGLDGIGGVVKDVVFGAFSNMALDKSYLEYYFRTPEGIMKGLDEKKPRVVLFNKADSIRFDPEMLNFKRDVDVLVVSEEKDELYHVL